MTNFIYYILMLNLSTCTNLSKKSEIEIIFENEDKLNLSESHDIFKIFNYFSSSIERWDKKNQFNLKEFKKSTFLSVLHLLKIKNLVNFSEDDFVDILLLIDFLGFNENICQNKIRVFWNTFVFNVLYKSSITNIKLKTDTIKILSQHINIVKIFIEICLINITPEAAISFKEDRIYIYEEDIIKIDPFYIIINKIAYDYIDNLENLNEMHYSKSFEIKNILLFFSQVLNLSKIFYFDKQYNLEILLFESLNLIDDKIKSIYLYETIDIIKNEYNPLEIFITDIFEMGNDIKFININSLKKLTIDNSKRFNLKITEFNLINLDNLYINNVNLSIRLIQQISNCKNLKRTTIKDSRILNEDDMNNLLEEEIFLTNTSEEENTTDDISLRSYYSSTEYSSSDITSEEED